jgi:hypothetical protein
VLVIEVRTVLVRLIRIKIVAARPKEGIIVAVRPIRVYPKGN